MGRDIRFGPCCFRQRLAMQTEQSEEGLHCARPALQTCPWSPDSRDRSRHSPWTPLSRVCFALRIEERGVRGRGGRTGVAVVWSGTDPTKRRIWDLPTSVSPKTNAVHGPLDCCPLPSTNPLIRAPESCQHWNTHTYNKWHLACNVMEVTGLRYIRTKNFEIIKRHDQGTRTTREGKRGKWKNTERKEGEGISDCA